MQFVLQFLMLFCLTVHITHKNKQFLKQGVRMENSVFIYLKRHLYCILRNDQYYVSGMTALPYITLWFDVVYNTWVNDYGGPDQTFSSTVWTLGVLPWGPVRIHHWGLCKCMCGFFLWRCLVTQTFILCICRRRTTEVILVGDKTYVSKLLIY